MAPELDRISHAGAHGDRGDAEAFQRRKHHAPRGPAAGGNVKRQRGVAVITAILIVAVSASAATLMLAQQSAMVDQAMLVAARAQADNYARAGLDWARGVLREDARAGDKVDFMGEGWAQPIAALPVERAIVSGSISDEQGK